MQLEVFEGAQFGLKQNQRLKCKNTHRGKVKVFETSLCI